MILEEQALSEADALVERLRRANRRWKALALAACAVAALMAFASFVGSARERRAARGEMHAVIPFVVEAWAEPIDGETADVRIAVNRTRITAPVRAHHSPKEKRISRFGCSLGHSFATGARPLRVRLNVETPHMPITSDGKAPDFEPIMEAIAKVMRKVAGASKEDRPPGKRSTQEAVVLAHDDRRSPSRLLRVDCLRRRPAHQHGPHGAASTTCSRVHRPSLALK